MLMYPAVLGVVYLVRVFISVYTLCMLKGSAKYSSCIGLYILQDVRLSIAVVLSRTVMTIGPLITGLLACTM